MRAGMMIGIAGIFLWTSVATAQTSNDDKSLPYGGVLCAWQALATMKAVAEHCFTNGSAEFKTALDEVVEKLTVLIVERSPEFQYRIEKKIARFRWEMKKIKKGSDGICPHTAEDDLLSFYPMIERDGGNKLRETVAPLLASSGRPIANSCLVP
jgi:hypothetical protein